VANQVGRIQNHGFYNANEIDIVDLEKSVYSSHNHITHKRAAIEGFGRYLLLAPTSTMVAAIHSRSAETRQAWKSEVNKLQLNT
jgi:hypothetical protein